ncbi:MAG: hypothetical protein Q7S82_02145 [bacterium]|nr:hypothetical protein [bacterium]
MKKNRTLTEGISIIEILVVIAILAVSFVSLLGMISFSLSASGILKQRLEADFLAQDTMEAVRNFRDETVWQSDGLGILTVDTAYYPQKTAGTPIKWILTLGSENIGIFTRKAVFEKVFRDSNDNIASSGVEDLNTKKAVVIVSWQEKGRTHSVELITYFTNWRQ